MRPLLLDPHGDDAVLFASYICMRFKPIICVTNRTVPKSEIAAATNFLGCSWQDGWEPQRDFSETIFAPGWHEVGHEEHNEVAEKAKEVYGDAVQFYCTYAPRAHRWVGRIPIVPTAEMIQAKLRALSCFRSQIEYEATRPWFYDLLDMREWLA